MDRSELKSCYTCGRGVMHGGDIHFYEVTVSQCIVDLNSVRQQAAMDLAVPGLGPLFSPSTSVAMRLPPVRMLFCSPCSLKTPHLIAVLASESDS